MRRKLTMTRMKRLGVKFFHLYGYGGHCAALFPLPSLLTCAPRPEVHHKDNGQEFGLDVLEYLVDMWNNGTMKHHW